MHVIGAYHLDTSIADTMDCLPAREAAIISSSTLSTSSMSPDVFQKQAEPFTRLPCSWHFVSACNKDSVCSKVPTVVSTVQGGAEQTCCLGCCLAFKGTGGCVKLSTVCISCGMYSVALLQHTTVMGEHLPVESLSSCIFNNAFIVVINLQCNGPWQALADGFC